MRVAFLFSSHMKNSHQVQASRNISPKSAHNSKPSMSIRKGYPK